MVRGRGLGGATGLVAGLALVATLAGCWGENEPNRRDVVVLMVIDTLRADHVGLYGYERATSPAFDAFAESATVFADVFAPAPWTLPSVASLMTGTYPSTHGLRARVGASRLVSLRSGLTTLAQAFQQNGFRTVAVVTNPWVTNKKHGLDVGFDEYRTEQRARADEVNRIAREVLEERDPRPVFLFLHYMDVHGPYRSELPADASLGTLPDRYLRAIQPEEIERVPKYMQLEGEGHLAAYVDAYDRGIRRWDASFGIFIDWLARTERLARTTIAVTSDHGEEFLDHGGWNHGTTLFQEQLSVPWVLHVPGGARGWVRGEVVSLIDVAPTLLGAMGIATPATMAGRDVLAAREGNDSADPRTLYAETEVRLGGIVDASFEQLAMRRADRKWIAGRGDDRCFDLRDDRAEQAATPRDGECADDEFDGLRRWAADTRRRAEQIGGQAEHRMTDDERRQLRELGYVE